MKRLVLIGVLATLVCYGCAASQPQTQKAMAGNAAGSVADRSVDSKTGRTVPGAMDDQPSDPMMDQQEAEMRDALATSEAAAIRREGALLAITLKGDVSLDPETVTLQTGLNQELDKIAQILIKYPQTEIVVEGHTDNTGSDTYNQQLSEHRAGMIKYQLVERGVPTQRIKIFGYGARRPVAPNATLQGREMNRRVEIRIQPNV